MTLDLAGVLRASVAGLQFTGVLAHGLNNTIGLVTFFLIGPIYGFW